MILRRLIRNFIDTCEGRLHNAAGGLVPKEQVIHEYLSLTDFLLKSLEPGSFVAVRQEHDYRALLSILACMDLGFPFAALGRRWPMGRIEQIKALLNAPLILDDETAEAACREAPQNQARDISLNSSSILYAMFTSGSSGEPKGVLIERRAFEGFLSRLALPETTPLEPRRRLLVADFSFDMSLIDVGMLLVRKNPIYFSRFDGDPFRLAHEIESLGIESLVVVPSTVDLLLSNAVRLKADYSTLRHLQIGGAPLVRETTRAVFSLLPQGLKVDNLYGPTETTVITHLNRLSGIESEDFKGPCASIGKPLPGIPTALLGSDGSLIHTPHVRGELLIGGDQLMRESLRPENDRDSFVELEGRRFYRTGDSAFEDETGRQHVDGRLDETIKRRGYRINLLDIDGYLRRISAIEDCATIAVQGPNGTTSLIACVVAKTPIKERGLLEELARSLIDYQIPDRVEFLDRLPLNASGKICRRTLAKRFA